MMRIRFCLFIFLIPFLVASQARYDSKLSWRAYLHNEKHWTDLLQAGIPAAISGISLGVNKASLFHYDAFKAVHPGANDKFWNVDLSDRNKWAVDASGRIIKGKERFWGSSTVFAFATDGYHLTEFASNTTWHVSLAMKPAEPGQTFLQHLCDQLILQGIRSAFFHLTYSVYYKA